METKNMKKLQLNEFERTLAEAFMRSHKCPWHRRLFDKSIPSYSFSQTSSGIGLYTIVRCDKCNKHFDITDYESW